jgi:hypothetical protein
MFVAEIDVAVRQVGYLLEEAGAAHWCRPELVLERV